MATIEIIQFASVDVSSDSYKNATKVLKDVEGSPNVVLSSKVQDQSSTQVTTDGTSEASSTVDEICKSLGQPSERFSVTLDKSALGPDGAATAPAVELVQVTFPASQATPAFKQQIEADFRKFDETFKREAKGDGGLAIGWREGDEEHPDVEGRKARSLIVIRGWESMGHFEQATKTQSYQEAVPILFAWQAPFQMVSLVLKVKEKARLTSE